MAGIKRPCARPGCPALVRSGYCEACKAMAPKRIAETKRLSSAARGYGWRWQKTSAGRLIKYPWCADPFKLHVAHPEPATCTDHIKAHKGDMRLFWDPTNWQSLCDSCNSRKAVEQEGAFGNPIAEARVS